MKYVLAVDFDGVIHRYGRGDLGQDIYDIPTPRAKEFLEQYIQAFDVHILSSRASTDAGVDAIHTWMKHYDLPSIPASNKKPDGELLVILDDRSWQFNGTFPSVEELLAFRPWWQRRDDHKIEDWPSSTTPA